MKHQYFGDLSDYKKYSVLRALAHDGQLRTMVAWMLTPNDEGNEGNVNQYLRKPDEWRQFEPDVFDFLHESVVVNETKDLRLVENNDIVPGTDYFWNILADNRDERQAYFKELHREARDHDIVFLDPDTGIATNSIVKGRKGSSKYIFWDEMEDLWDRDHSLLVYQHFPRVNRIAYINDKIDEIRSNLDFHQTYAIRTTYMVYFLILQEGHAPHLEGLKDSIEGKWGSDRIMVEKF